MTDVALRTTLRIDAAVGGAMGAALALGAGPLGALTDLPPGLLRWVGIALLPIAGFMAATAAREPIAPALAWIVVAGNWAWVAASLALTVSGIVAPNAFGIAFVAAQASVVAGFAVLEQAGLRARAQAPAR